MTKYIFMKGDNTAKFVSLQTRKCSAILLCMCMYIGSPDGHETIASGVSVLEHGTVPFIPASSQPVGERERLTLTHTNVNTHTQTDTLKDSLDSRGVAIVMDNVEV